MTWQGSERRTLPAAVTNNTALTTTAGAAHYGLRIGLIGTGVFLWPDTATPAIREINTVFSNTAIATSTNPILFQVYPKIFRQYRLLTARITARFDRVWLDPGTLINQTAMKYTPMYAFIVASIDPDEFNTLAKTATFISLQYIRQQRYHKLKKIDPDWQTLKTVNISMSIKPTAMLANSGAIYKNTNTISTAGPYSFLTSITGETPQFVYIWWGVVTEDGAAFAAGTTGNFTTRNDLKLTQKVLFMEPHTNSEIGAL